MIDDFTKVVLKVREGQWAILVLDFYNDLDLIKDYLRGHGYTPNMYNMWTKIDIGLSDLDELL